MKLLLTGASGFLGRRLVTALAPRHELRLLLRPTSRRTGFPDGVEVVVGDLADPGSLRRAAAGRDAVVHAAALVKIAARADEYERTNVTGLAALLAAARGAAIPHVVHVSSFMALGPTEALPGGVADESAGTGERRWINEYERTKTAGDRLARAAIAAGEPVSIVYPAVVYGPGELTEGNLVTRHLLDLAHGRLPALLGRPERRWCFVHVDDVAAGIAAAVERSQPGGRWILGGENATLASFYRLVGELGSVRVPGRRLPDPLARAAGALVRAWAELHGTVPLLTPDLVEVYRHDWAYSSARAEAELGYRPRPLAAGLAGTIDWLREDGAWPA